VPAFRRHYPGKRGKEKSLRLPLASRGERKKEETNVTEEGEPSRLCTFYTEAFSSSFGKGQDIFLLVSEHKGKGGSQTHVLKGAHPIIPFFQDLARKKEEERGSKYLYVRQRENVFAGRDRVVASFFFSGISQGKKKKRGKEVPRERKKAQS